MIKTGPSLYSVKSLLYNYKVTPRGRPCKGSRGGSNWSPVYTLPDEFCKFCLTFITLLPGSYLSFATSLILYRTYPYLTEHNLGITYSIYIYLSIRSRATLMDIALYDGERYHTASLLLAELFFSDPDLPSYRHALHVRARSRRWTAGKLNMQ